MALYRATNGSSTYPYDPEYGGKLSMRTYIARDENQPAPPSILPEKPHIVDDVAARYCYAKSSGIDRMTSQRHTYVGMPSCRRTYPICMCGTTDTSVLEL